MAEKMKRHKNKKRTDCSKCENCIMIIRDLGGIYGRYSVVCKQVPESMRYSSSHYAGTVIPKYCSMFVDKTIDMMYYTKKD